ncbi:DUF4147 domain-containing protein [Deinococcus sp. HMF7604]|uniref:glycerate kinase type-2 family protein n=1 Tax=Deinococcus betulae TaxID=2873312 RepID=UPI001CCCEDBA|nr:DUF4147 domain-containing protein [Deinococcus betulae]MBZ9750274.1 DUF4147 domain-containing protein [Deinococcus betulae]
MSASPLSHLLSETYHAALAATAPDLLLGPYLSGRTPDFILAVGKAAAPMMRAAQEAFPAVPGLLVLPDGAPLPAFLPQVEVRRAAHPLPDARSVAAARLAQVRLGALTADQEVLALFSGGASALLCAPRGVTLAQKAAVCTELMRAGADIQALNTVRRHLSDVKGGRLAAGTRARVRALLLSDVVGDDPATIASGPAVPDPTTYADALAVLDRFAVPAPEVRPYLRAGAQGLHEETPSVLLNAHSTVIGGNGTLLRAAQAALESKGIRAVILGETFTGEARDLAVWHAAEVRRAQAEGVPVALISGGEATVTVRGAGRGGRNTEFALALALALGDDHGVYGLSAGSDGVDGTSGGAGALLTPDTLRRAATLGLDAPGALAANDSGSFFAALGDLLVPGPTGQNLNDLRVLLVEPV